MHCRLAAASGEEADWAKAEREWGERGRGVDVALGSEQSADDEEDAAAAAREVCFEVRSHCPFRKKGPIILVNLV